MLITTRRFFPFFLSQTLGAFNDNLYRNALVLLITFAFAEQLQDKTASVAALTSALFVLPFFVFSASAGRIADRIDKARLVQLLKWSEVAVMLMAALGFYLMNLWLLMAMLFLMGTQSALFGPAKYAIIPQLVPPEKLLAANAWVEASTFVVILGGMILSSALMLTEHGRLLVSAACVLLALAGAIASNFIPALPARSKSLRLKLRIIGDTVATLRYGWSERHQRPHLLGIAWFWALGSVFVTLIPPFARETLGADESSVMPLLAAFTLGVAGGAFACVKLQRGTMNTRNVMPASLCIAAMSVILLLALGVQIDALSPLATSGMCLLLLAVGGGMFVVPLYSLLQHHADPRRRGRLVAASNIFNAMGMTLASLLNAALLAAGVPLVMVWAAWGVATPLLWKLATRNW